MNKDQHASLFHINRDLSLRATDLTEHYTNRTLLYGYDGERNTHHVYLQDGLIHLHTYNFKKETLSHEARATWMTPEVLVPSKRTYPEPTAYDFAVELKKRGIYIAFANFDSTGQVTATGGEFHRPVWGEVLT